MKKIKFLSVVIFLALAISGVQAAEYQARYKIQATTGLEPFNPAEKWSEIEPTYTEWLNSGEIRGCTNWLPSEESIVINQSFTQTATDCEQPQTRTRQNREQDLYSKVIRNLGSVIKENQGITVALTRNAIGTKENWIATTPLYTEWVNNGTLTNCTNWSPLNSTVTVNQPFTQTATDCQQPQTRSRQNREQESTTSNIRNVGAATSESQNVTVSSTRSATGTKENWADIEPSYTTWTNSGSPVNCTNWSPLTSTIAINQTFTQTATDCQQSQTRSRQNRQQESTTNEIRNVGVATSESQNITVSSERSATGTKENWIATTPTYTTWVNNGTPNSCTNWSPEPSTVTYNQAFTQTATDCKQTQTRSKQNREQETSTGAIRNSGAVVAESQSITASSTRTATGTKETWVAIGASYTAWANSGVPYNCSNWAPSTQTRNRGVNFTQTATNCQQSQTRTRQDREQSNSGAVRNVGSPVTESQTVSASSTRAAVGTYYCDRICQGGG